MSKISYFLRWLLVVVGVGLVKASFALQVISVKENDSIQATISGNELTRIAVEQDRILHVRGLEGTYELKHDASQGALFLRPTVEYQNKPFTLFIATEQNHNYVLHLVPKEKPADTLVLKPKGASMLAVRWETGPSYTKTLASLMTYMMTGDTPPYYAVNAVTGKKCGCLCGNVSMQLERIYLGAHLKGQVYRLLNHSKQTIVLSEKEFYQANDRAIALSQLTIAPGEQVLLYKVGSNG